MTHYSHYEKIGEVERCIDDEMPFEIPDSWVWARLCMLTSKEIRRGKSPMYSPKSDILVFAQKCNTKAGRIDISLSKYLDETVVSKYPNEEYLCDKDIIVNSTGTGTMGRIGIYRTTDNPNNMQIVPDSHVTIIRCVNFIMPEYVFYCLKTYQQYLEEHGEGSTNQKELKPYTIANLLIPLPPLQEERRIVSGLSRSFTMCDKLKQ